MFLCRIVLHLIIHTVQYYSAEKKSSYFVGKVPSKTTRLFQFWSERKVKDNCFLLVFDLSSNSQIFQRKSTFQEIACFLPSLFWQVMAISCGISALALMIAFIIRKEFVIAE